MFGSPRRPFRTTLLLTFSALAGFPAAAQDATRGGQLTFDVIFASHPSGRLPSQMQWSPDGERLAYLWEDEQGSALWVQDLESGERREVLRASKTGENRGLDVDAYQWSPAGDALLLESGGDLRLLHLDDLEVHRLPETEGAERIPAFSPDGGQVAFARDNDLFVVDLSTGGERRLTTDGEQDVTINALTDWVYWEEIWGRRATGFWWSPDGSRIAFYRFDERPVASYALVDFMGVPYPEVEWQKYPKAGTANPVVRVGVVDLGAGETTWMRTGEDTDVYLVRVAWRGDGKLVIQRLNREQNQLDLLLCDPGGSDCAVLLTEEWPTWINLHEDLFFLKDGRFVWSSEASGWRRLHLHAADGHRIRALSAEGWAVTSLDAVSESAGWYLFTAHATGPLGAKDRTVFVGDLADGSTRALTSGGGWHAAQVAPETGSWVHRWSSADRPHRVVVRDLEGATVADLPAERPTGYDPAELPAWEFLTIPGPNGTRLPAALLKPADFDASRRYPAIMYHYGGPGSQVVADVWSSRGPWHKMMAERGYVVLKVDNLASRFFGKHGEDRAHRRFGEINLAAQLAGVEYLKGLGFVDVSRLGLWGWSGGGTHTLYAILNSPGTWRAAVSGAPVTDWRLYDTIWTERFLDHPEDNPEGYQLSSPVTHAANLKDNLLIVHGTADDNVHPQNTLVLVDRLIQAGVRFEQAIYPRQRHGFRGGASRHFYEHMTEFFDRHLLAEPSVD